MFDFFVFFLFYQTLPERLPGYRSHCWVETRPSHLYDTVGYYYQLEKYCSGGRRKPRGVAGNHPASLQSKQTQKRKTKQQVKTKATLAQLMQANATKTQQAQGKRRTMRQLEATHSKENGPDVKHKHHSQIRCFPYFYLLGFAKSGTTDLYESLTSLPSVYRQWKKEPDFWSRQRMKALGWSNCHPKPGETLRSLTVTSECTSLHPRSGCNTLFSNSDNYLQ